MMRDLYNALPLPDDRPIQSLCIVEELSGCPPNYTIVSKTHDQDIDADLYKDGFFRRETRYLCHSKVEGYMGYVIENIQIINSRDGRPPGYTIIEQTFDTSQKALKKKQICYKAVPRHLAIQTVTDIIILSRAKLAPEGFCMVGELNGMCLCYKKGPPVQPQFNKPAGSGNSPLLPYGVGPNGSRGSISSVGSGSLYPGMDLQRPSRQAPMPPGSGPGTPQSIHAPPLPPRNPSYPYPAPSPSPSHPSQVNNTIYGPAQSALAGVPFVLNKKYVAANDNSISEPVLKMKSKQQIEDEFYYSFSLEQDLLQQPKT